MNTTLPLTARWDALKLRQVTFDTRTRQDIMRAAAEFQVSPALIASIMADEKVRLDLADRLKNSLMRLVNGLPAVWAKRLTQLTEKGLGRSADTLSLGHAQMKGITLQKLARAGYLQVKDSPQARRTLLLNNREAPRIVAACLRATADHWAAQGVSIEHRPDILGTLYSIGLSGQHGIHAHPQASTRGKAIAEHAQWLGQKPHSNFPTLLSIS